MAMQIGLTDIDPQIAEAVADRLAAPLSRFLRDNVHWNASNPGIFSWEFSARGLKVKRKRDPNQDERAAYALRRRRENEMLGRAAGTGVLAACAGAGVAFAAQATHLGDVASVACGLALGIPTLVAGGLYTARAVPRARLKRRVRPEEMRAVFPLLTLTRVERIYCDTLLMLSRMEPDRETERELRDTLGQLNRLVSAARQLEQRRQSLLPLLGSNVIPELETEFGELGRRLDRASDPITRQSLEQSLQMCAERIRNAQALTDGMERIRAQSEAILHTISSAQSAMARLQVTPEMRTGNVSAEITQAVARLNQQTAATEQAVQEVMTLRL